MASIVLTAAGYAAGAALPGVGALAAPLLGAVGGIVGGTLDAKLGLVRTQSASGPRLESLRVQDSREGAPLPILYGMLRVAGNIIWASPLLETRHKSGSGGFKGGVGARTTTYSYAVHLAVSLGAAPISNVHRIWADSKLIYDGGAAPNALDPAYAAATRIYDGRATQSPDALLESYLGLGNVPAYRGTGYAVIEGLQLEAFGNRIPNLTFEVEGQSGGFAPAAPQMLDLVDNANNLQAPFYVRDAGGGIILSAGLTDLGGSAYRFTIDHHRWRSDGFAFDGRVTTANFTGNSGNFSAALSPDRKRLFLCHIAAGGALRIALYDIASRSFGPLTAYGSYLPASAIFPGCVWLDGQTVLLPASDLASNGPLAITCIGVTPLPQPSPGSFLPLWIADSNHDYITAPFALPTAIASTLLLVTTNTAKTVLHGAYVSPLGGSANGRLQAKLLPDFTLGTVTGMGTIGMQRLHPLADGTLLRVATTTSGMIVAETLRHDATGFTVTRAAVALPLTITVFYDVLLPAPGVFTLLTAIDGTYGAAEIALTPTGFAVISDYKPGSGAVPDAVPPRAARLGPYDFALAAGRKLYRFKRGTPARSLGGIVADLTVRAGLAAGDLDTGAGSQTLVAGFAVTQPLSARRALESLLAAYPFTLGESDGQLRLADLRTASVTPLPDSALHATRDETASPLSLSRAQARDVPRALALDFYDADNLYQPGSARAAIDADPAAPAETASLPLVLAPAGAQLLAARLLMRAQAERIRIACAVPRDYQQLDPGDLVTVGGRAYSLTAIRQQGGLLRLEAAGFNPAALDAAPGSLALAAPVIPSAPGATLFAFDLPPLRGEDTPGLYLGAVAADGWPGGIVYETISGGIPLERARLTAPLTFGIATMTLADGPTAYPDSASTLTLVTTAPLISCTDEALLAGANLALVGAELLQFRIAVLTGPQTYTLSNLLRGRYGTEGATATHISGESVFLLEETAVARMGLALADRGRAATLAVVSLGQTVDSALPVTVTCGLASLKPYTPTALTATASGGDIQIGWTRRARLNNGWNDNIELPLDEPAERYALDLYSGATLLRSVIVGGPPGYLYSAAQQTADFGGAVTALTITVAQLSDRYGRGADASASFGF